MKNHLLPHFPAYRLRRVLISVLDTLLSTLLVVLIGAAVAACFCFYLFGR